jgi:hypothetical protein
VLCEQAMIDAFCDSSDRVTANIVTKVARDVVGSAALRDATPAQRETLLRDEEKVGESAEGMQVLKRSCL